MCQFFTPVMRPPPPPPRQGIPGFGPRPVDRPLSPPLTTSVNQALCMRKLPTECVFSPSAKYMKTPHSCNRDVCHVQKCLPMTHNAAFWLFLALGYLLVVVITLSSGCMCKCRRGVSHTKSTFNSQRLWERGYNILSIISF